MKRTGYRSRDMVPPSSRRAFTLIETLIVSGLMGFLAVLISATWSAFIRPTTDIANRCRIAQEASLALASLSRDLGGSLADNLTGTTSQYQIVGRMQPGTSQLRICYDGGSTPNGPADWWKACMSRISVEGRWRSRLPFGFAGSVRRTI